MFQDDAMLCPQTIKYLQGLAAGKWIVSNEWLRECVERKELTNEVLGFMVLFVIPDISKFWLNSNC